MSHRQTKSRPTLSHRWTRPLAAVGAACLVSLSPAPPAGAVSPPAVPPGLEVPDGYKVTRIDHAVGTQNYVCLPSAAAPGFKWTFFGPQATLFNEHGRQSMTHFLSANPEEGGTLRPTWQDSRDSSAIWAEPIQQSTDPAYVEPGAVPWLLLQVRGATEGPTGGVRVARNFYVQRINTSGGTAPAAGCAEAGDVGKKLLVPYETDYVFYRATRRAP